MSKILEHLERKQFILEKRLYHVQHHEKESTKIGKKKVDLSVLDKLCTALGGEGIQDGIQKDFKKGD